MVSVKLYVEGGGDSLLLKTACRSGFAEFLKKAGLAGKMPRIVACGSRQNAYEDFCTAVKKGDSALLLVDSETAVDANHWDKPWLHLLNRPGDKWAIPAGATDQQCHLMVECMEAWLLADRATMHKFFGQGFNASALPVVTNSVEAVTKPQLYQALTDATRHCKTKAKYGKGEHSFKLLAAVDANKVSAASPWAKRFIEITKQQMGV